MKTCRAMLMIEISIALVLAGCTPTFRFETCAAEDPALAEWRAQITSRVNKDAVRLDRLEEECQCPANP